MQSVDDVVSYPAPWAMSGTAWAVLLRLPADAPARRAFLPADRAALLGGPFACLMFVDYAEAPCGPYHELMLIPGTLPFDDGKRHYTISRILVSSMASVVNGRRNWGIPKELAEFSVQYDRATRQDDIVTRINGRDAANLRFAAGRFALPVHGALVPQTLRTLAQACGGKTFLYAPASSGWLRPGRLLDWHFDGTLFPDLAGARVIGALRLEDFRMTFPVAHVIESVAGGAQA